VSKRSGEEYTGSPHLEDLLDHIFAEYKVCDRTFVIDN
jgi:hypothetical protein